MGTAPRSTVQKARCQETDSRSARDNRSQHSISQRTLLKRIVRWRTTGLCGPSRLPCQDPDASHERRPPQSAHPRISHPPQTKRYRADGPRAHHRFALYRHHRTQRSEGRCSPHPPRQHLPPRGSSLLRPPLVP